MFWENGTLSKSAKKTVLPIVMDENEDHSRRPSARELEAWCGVRNVTA
jgi:hypothetical protein